MAYAFVKYHGTGNDFVLLHDFAAVFPHDDSSLVARMCNRHFGIGADGLMLLRPPVRAGQSFSLLYFNADGKLGSLCGNGSRCAVALAKSLGLFSGHAVSFEAADGERTAFMEANGTVRIRMADASLPQAEHGGYFVDTGSPHWVGLVTDLADYPVVLEGKRIRNEVYGPSGVNANFLEQDRNHRWHLRTYERGVEDETLSCGTGATAAALVLAYLHPSNEAWTELHTQGGLLRVRAQSVRGGFQGIELEGPAELVFSGTWPIL
ncbi:MAG: diaminopimelate epimerase [Schleiferiaceae bacterium]|jgi:diaminopimelate epimerase|nr:diaminopimelate epimerase [Schleiferiaceae bacterium]MDP4627433.1 diaminopimelate epimerase [Schleiferiaceae bacterium]MDP4727838.1 diaminopimelate epimerase [Schleiferiaceae bacterium]MDP4749677.1 diaminopimelate epimerase [Schleiferiaceae bacterium]MDP4859950.1 diaminopimelate epimerase [Schleiferiaceae bacterium]